MQNNNTDTKEMASSEVEVATTTPPKVVVERCPPPSPERDKHIKPIKTGSGTLPKTSSWYVNVLNCNCQ